MDLIYKKPRFKLEEKLIDSIIRLMYVTCFVCKRAKLGSLESVIHFHSEYVHFLLVRFRFYVEPIFCPFDIVADPNSAMHIICVNRANHASANVKMSKTI